MTHEHGAELNFPISSIESYGPMCARRRMKAVISDDEVSCCFRERQHVQC
jgi:hypothetical protein